MKGLSLPEVLLALTLTVVIMTLSYPSYTHLLANMRRQAACLELIRIEGYWIRHQKLPVQMPESDHYQFQVSSDSEDHVKVVAVPQAWQAKQDTCGMISLDNLSCCPPL